MSYAKETKLSETFRNRVCYTCRGFKSGRVCVIVCNTFGLRFAFKRFLNQTNLFHVFFRPKCLVFPFTNLLTGKKQATSNLSFLSMCIAWERRDTLQPHQRLESVGCFHSICRIQNIDADFWWRGYIKSQCVYIRPSLKKWSHSPQLKISQAAPRVSWYRQNLHQCGDVNRTISFYVEELVWKN